MFQLDELRRHTSPRSLHALTAFLISSVAMVNSVSAQTTTPQSYPTGQIEEVVALQASILKDTEIPLRASIARLEEYRAATITAAVTGNLGGMNGD